VVNGVLTTVSNAPPAPPGTTTPPPDPATSFSVSNAANPSDPITESTPVLLRSNDTGKYCGAVVVAGGTQMVCNITDPADATPVTIVNGHIYYSNAPLMPTYVGQPALFTNSTIASPPGSATPSAFQTILPAREYNTITNCCYVISMLLIGHCGSLVPCHQLIQDTRNKHFVDPMLSQSLCSALLHDNQPHMCFLLLVACTIC
jgi:hypothetical protein